MGTSITSRKVSAEGGAVSDRTRQLRDDEQQHLADEAHALARCGSSPSTATSSTQLARALLRNEVLEREDIDRIMDGVPRIDRTPRPRPAGRRRQRAGRSLTQAASARCRSSGRWRSYDPLIACGCGSAPHDFRELLEPGAIRAVFQPIVRLSDLAADRLRGPRPLPHAARPGRAAARRHARRRRPLRPAPRARGRLLGGDHRRRRAARRPAAVRQHRARRARPPRPARARRPAAASGS